MHVRGQEPSLLLQLPRDLLHIGSGGQEGLRGDREKVYLRVCPRGTGVCVQAVQARVRMSNVLCVKWYGESAA